MKRLLLAFLLCAAPLSLAVVQTGCTTTQKTATFNSLHATAVIVDNAYSAFWDLVVAGKVDAATQAKVQNIRAKYQAAFVLAVSAAQFDYTAPTPANVGALAADLVTTIQTLIK
jgi:hypothetical protein